MDTKFLAVLFIILTVILAVVAIGEGFYISNQAQKFLPVQQAAINCSQTLQKIQATIKDLNSKVISLIVLGGQVKDINGRNITLDYKGRDINVKVADTAKIEIMAPSGNADILKGPVNYVRQPIEFSQIKKGDYLKIYFSIGSEGQIEGHLVTIWDEPIK